MKTINKNLTSFSLFKIALPLLFLLVFPMAANAQDVTPQEKTCADMVQNKVAWNKAGQTKWAPSNVQRLCRGTTNPTATIACFKNIINTSNDYNRGIKECSVAKPNAPTKLGLNGNWDGYFADGTKSTYVWKVSQNGSTLSFLDVGAGTNTSFSATIQGNKITDSNGNTGALSANGTQIQWADGVVWKRRTGSPSNSVAALNDAPTGNTGSFTPTITIKNNGGGPIQAILDAVTPLGGAEQEYKSSGSGVNNETDLASSVTLSGSIPANDSARLSIKVFGMGGASFTAMQSILPRNSQLTTFCYEVTGTYFVPIVKECNGGDTYESKYILIKNEAGYNSVANLTYNKLDGSGAETFTTLTMTAGYQRKLYLPTVADTSKPMTLKLILTTALGNRDVLTRTVSLSAFDSSGSTCYKAWGSIFSPKGDSCSTSGRKITFKNNGAYQAKMSVTYYDKDSSGRDVPTTVTGNPLEVLESDSIEVPVTSSTTPITVSIKNNWGGKEFFTTPVAANFTGELCFKSEGTTFNPNASACDGTVGGTSGNTRQIRFQNDAGYDAKMIVGYYVDEMVNGKKTSNMKMIDTGFINGLGGNFRLVTIPKNTTSGKPVVVVLVGNATMNNQILTVALPGNFAASPQPCYKTWGTLFNPSGGTCNQ